MLVILHALACCFVFQQGPSCMNGDQVYAILSDDTQGGREELENSKTTPEVWGVLRPSS